MTYAKDENGKLEYPTQDEFAGIPNWQDNDAALRRRDYMPLIGEAEPREGYEAKPGRWHVVIQSETRMEPRCEDPVTKEPFIEVAPDTGEARQVTRIVPVEFDTSYIQVDVWRYIPVPEPEPEPPPVVRYSKYKIQLACQTRGLWEQVKAAIASAGLQDSWSNIVDIASDNKELQAALPDIETAFGAETVAAVLAESVAE